MRIRKVSQTTPTQAQVVDGYSTSEVDSYSCNYVNSTLGTILYDNDTGSTNNLSLNDSSTNYDIIDVIYSDNNNNYNSVRVMKPNGKKVCLMTNMPVSGGSYIKTKVVTISGANITNNEYNQIAMPSGSSPTITGDNLIKIHTVIGYNTGLF